MKKYRQLYLQTAKKFFKLKVFIVLIELPPQTVRIQRAQSMIYTKFPQDSQINTFGIPVNPGGETVASQFHGVPQKPVKLLETPRISPLDNVGFQFDTKLKSTYVQKEPKIGCFGCIKKRF